MAPTFLVQSWGTGTGDSASASVASHWGGGRVGGVGGGHPPVTSSSYVATDSPECPPCPLPAFTEHWRWTCIPALCQRGGERDLPPGSSGSHILPRGTECTLATWVRAPGHKACSWHTPTARTHHIHARTHSHTHTCSLAHGAGGRCAQTLTYKDTRALVRHSETLRNPSDNPKPLGAAESTLLGACMSQSSGHDGGRHDREVGRCWGSSPLFLV